jgi:hypothetical protein
VIAVERLAFLVADGSGEQVAVGPDAEGGFAGEVGDRWASHDRAGA